MVFNYVKMEYIVLNPSDIAWAMGIVLGLSQMKGPMHQLNRSRYQSVSFIYSEAL